MPRPKGSKNKVVVNAETSIDYAALIDEKQSAKDALSAEVTSIAANIDSLKSDLKSKKTEIKKLDKELAKLAEKKDEADKKAAEAAAEKEAVDLVKKALANGTTVDDILELLK
nr:MAG TPA: hypothetical protein [Siphoviridae sp. ctHdl3]